MTAIINLAKGGRIDLSKEAPALKRVRFELSWQPNVADTGSTFDLDATCFGLKYDAKGNPVLADGSWMLFYNNTTSPDGSAVHGGDNKTGDGDGEKITVDLTAVGPEIQELSFVVTIYDAVTRKQNFGQVRKSSIAVFDDDTNTCIGRYDLEDDFSSETAVQFGSLYRKDDKWLVKAVGVGFNKGLADFVRIYGFEASE